MGSYSSKEFSLRIVEMLLAGRKINYPEER